MLNRSRLLIALTWGIAVFIAAPLLVLGATWWSPDAALWQHFSQTLLPEVALNTLVLLVGVGLGTLLLGGGLAWLVSLCEFPGRRMFAWMLFLPFAIPAYVLGFVYLGLFDYAGALQTFLRELGLASAWDPRGTLGVIVLFTLVFYPYVYLLARASFSLQSLRLIESAKTLGKSDGRIFAHISLPMARPALVAGVILALMETLSDFGLVSLMAYDTFTTAIYSAWEDYRSVEVAAQIASVLVLLSFGLIMLERYSRGAAKYHGQKREARLPYQLKGWKAGLASGGVALVLVLAFFLPMGRLVYWALQGWSAEWDGAAYGEWIGSTLSLALMAGSLTLMVSLLFVWLKRESRDHPMVNLGVRLATLGYALPGSVMAIGVLYALGWMSEWLAMGSLGVLLFAYLSRFIAVAYGPIESAVEQVKPSIIDAAQSLGASRMRVMLQVYVPLLVSGMSMAFMLVAVDVMKELPATYLLRPFGWDTLAIRIYDLSLNAQYEEAAVPSLFLVALTLLILLTVNQLSGRFRG